MKRSTWLILAAAIIPVVLMAWRSHNEAEFWKSQSQRWESAFTQAHADRMEQSAKHRATLDDCTRIAGEYNALLRAVRAGVEKKRRVR